MRILIMGTGPFAVPTFESLLQSEHEILGLVTRPDKVARGRKQAPHNPMRAVAIANNVEVFTPESINAEEGIALLESIQADLFVVCDYGQILSSTALEKAKLGGINLHGSLLPKYRGAAPIQWALLHGDTVAGVTVIHMTPRLDGGPMLCQRSLEVGAYENAGELEPRLAQAGVAAVHEAIGMLAAWDGETPLGKPQNADEVTKAPRLKKSDGRIDWAVSAREISHRVRALQPWPGTFTNLLRTNKPPMRIIIREIAIIDENEQEPAAPGTAQLVDSKLIVQCGQGAISISQIQPAGKREMTADEFTRGYGTQLQFGGD